MKTNQSRKLNLIVVMIIGAMSVIGFGCRSHLTNHTYYPLSVDYARTFSDMVKAGQYDYINTYITEKNFPIERPDNIKSVNHIQVALVCLNKMINTDAVLLHIFESNMRPARIEELLAFGEKYPKIQQDVAIFSLYSSDFLRYIKTVPFLYRDVSGRTLEVGFFESDWNEYNCFLSVVR